MFFLADQLGRRIDEIQAMPSLEFTAWLVYFARKAQMVQVGNFKAQHSGR